MDKNNQFLSKINHEFIIGDGAKLSMVSPINPSLLTGILKGIDSSEIDHISSSKFKHVLETN